MKFPRHYKSVHYGEIPVPSTVVAPIPAELEEPTLSYLNRQLTRKFGDLYTLDPVQGNQSVTSFLQVDLTLPGIDFSKSEDDSENPENKLLEVNSDNVESLKEDWGDPELEQQYKITILRIPDILEEHLSRENLPDHDWEKVKSCEWGIAVETYFYQSMANDFHEQLKLAWLFSPEAPTLIDLSACTIRSRSWLRQRACSLTPPRADDFYHIDVVSKTENKGRFWLHTHGLLRCRTFELELHGVESAQLDEAKKLIHQAAYQFRTTVLEEPGVPFNLVREIPITWLPWEKALSRLPAAWPGNRKDRNEYHQMPSAVLLLRKKILFLSRYRTAAAIIPKLKDCFWDFNSREESRKLEKAAHQRYPEFRRLFEKYGTKKGWLFMIRVRLELENPLLENDCERCWIRPETAGEDGFTGALINDPAFNKSRKEGQLLEFTLDEMTDWHIINNQGTFNAINFQNLID